jgi:hypothetical protein
MAQEFDAKTGEIRQAVEQRRVQDVKILQKVNAVHREAFVTKFPGQIEHCMRLIAERLQHGLKKDADIQLSDCSARDLSQALLNLYQIHTSLDQAQ